jgi:hypothetical protein
VGGVGGVGCVGGVDGVFLFPIPYSLFPNYLLKLM